MGARPCPSLPAGAQVDEVTTVDPRPTPAELEQVVLMATYAPSVHNTQPWRFVSTPGGLQLEMD